MCHRCVAFGVKLAPFVSKSDISGRKRLWHGYGHISIFALNCHLLTCSHWVAETVCEMWIMGQRNVIVQTRSTHLFCSNTFGLNLFALSSVDRGVNAALISVTHWGFYSPIRLISQLIVHFGRRFPISWLQTYVYFHFHHHVSCCKFM